MQSSFNSITLICAVLLLVQCKKDDESKGLKYGAEYFECKINGEVFETSGHFSCERLYFDFYPEAYLNTPEKYMVFGGRNCENFTNLSIRINGMNHENGMLDFLNPSFADSIFPYYGFIDDSSGEFAVVENLISGEMNIEEFIPRTNQSSPYGAFKGTFNFTVTDTVHFDTIRITEGRFRFDVKQIF